MSDCMCTGLVASLRNWTSNNKQGCNLSISASSGELYKFISRKQLPQYDFGTPVVVSFDIQMFNEKPNNLIATDIKLLKEEK